MKKRLAYISVAIVLAVTLTSLAHAADHTRTLTAPIFGRQGQPVPKAVVYLKNTKSLAVKTYVSDQDGSYRFPALSPNVDYEVYTEHNGARSDTKTLSAFDNRKLVNITLRIK